MEKWAKSGELDSALPKKFLNPSRTETLDLKKMTDRSNCDCDLCKRIGLVAHVPKTPPPRQSTSPVERSPYGLRQLIKIDSDENHLCCIKNIHFVTKKFMFFYTFYSLPLSAIKPGPGKHPVGETCYPKTKRLMPIEPPAKKICNDCGQRTGPGIPHRCTSIFKTRRSRYFSSE